MTEKYIAIGIYLVILSLITWFSARRKNVGDFLFASHDVGWRNLSVSIFASVISSYNVVLTLTFAFLFGPYILLVFLGALAAFLGIYFIAKKYKAIIQEPGFNNIIDFFAHKFDSKTATTLNLAFILVLFIFIILQLFINTSVFSQLMGWNKYVSSIFVGAIVLAYTTIGGLKAEIYTDIFQGILMFLVIALVFMVDTSAITGETVGAILSDKTILVGAISMAAGQFLTLIVQPEMWQRVAAARSIPDIKKGFIVSWVLLTLFIIPEILIGLSARASGAIEDPSNLFYDILATSAPAWFLPFLVVGLFAAFMSTLDSSLFAISSQLGKYGFIVRRGVHQENIAEATRDKIAARNTRISIAVISVLALVLSLFFADFLSAVFGLISLLTVISVVVLLSLIFKLSSNETFVAILVSIAAFSFALFGGFITQEPVTSLYPSFALIGYMIVQTFVVRGYRRFLQERLGEMNTPKENNQDPQILHEKRQNWRLEYEQIMATLHNTELIALGFVLFMIPLISWGLTLTPGSPSIFCKQDIVNIGKLSIGIWFFYMISSFYLYFSKILKLRRRAKEIWKKLTDDENTEDQPTHIDILTSRNVLNYSLILMLIGVGVCYLWIRKYSEILSSFW